MVAAKEQMTSGPGTLSRRSANPNSTCNKLFFNKERNTRAIADAGLSIGAKNRSKETNKTLNVAIEVQVHMTTRHPECK